MSEVKNWSAEARFLALIILISGGIIILWYFHGILSPLIIAAIIAYLLHPAVDFLASRTRLSYSFSVFIVYIVSVLLLGAVIALITPVLINQIRAIEVDLESMVEYYDNLLVTPIELFRWTLYPGQFLPQLPKISTDLLTPLMNNFFIIFEAVTKNFLWVLLSLVSIYYFLQDGHNIQNWLAEIAPDEYQEDFHRLYEQLQHVWADYLRSQLVFMFVVGMLDSIVWLSIGLPGAIVLGILTGLTSFVHEIGAIISGVLSVLAALIGGSSLFHMSNFWFAVLVLILYSVLTGIKNIWLRPIIIGRHVHLHAGVVFVVVIAALVFHGALAAFLVVPVLISLFVIGRYLRRRIFGLPPFPEGQDPTSYFFINKS
jgi:predicted PurR-regulated permease PerM